MLPQFHRYILQTTPVTICSQSNPWTRPTSSLLLQSCRLVNRNLVCWKVSMEMLYTCKTHHLVSKCWLTHCLSNLMSLLMWQTSMLQTRLLLSYLLKIHLSHWVHRIQWKQLTIYFLQANPLYLMKMENIVWLKNRLVGAQKGVNWVKLARISIVTRQNLA